jgi:hypothetical protein
MPVPSRAQGGGRTKIYCKPACKQAAYRAAHNPQSTPATSRLRIRAIGPAGL